jgi:hypothetical protein
MLSYRCLIISVLALLLLTSACSDSVETIELSDSGWELEAIGLPVAELYKILSVQQTDMPTYNDCADAQNQKQPSSRCSLDLLFMPSPDYAGDAEIDFSEHVQQIITDVFGSESPLNRHTGYGQPLRPFSFFVTEFRYPENTPASGACSPGLPEEWVPPEPNLADVDLPAWDCNVALGTAGVELDVGFIVHIEPENDRNRYNLFSSEYNSYAAILHELSHAAFVMSDEAPSALESGRFLTHSYPNVFSVQSQEQQAFCEATCAAHDSVCVGIPRIDRNGEIIEGQSIYARCGVPDESEGEENNLLFFYPQPLPGENDNWADYDYFFEAVNRLDYIYRICNRAGC